MTEDTARDGRDWPTHCPSCGTELEHAVIDMDPTDEPRVEFRPGEMVAVDYCPNPDCPGKKEDAEGSSV